MIREVVRTGLSDDPGVVVCIDRDAGADIATGAIATAAQVSGIDEGLAVGADLGDKDGRRPTLTLAAFGDARRGAKLRVAQRTGWVDHARGRRVVDCGCAAGDVDVAGRIHSHAVDLRERGTAEITGVNERRVNDQITTMIVGADLEA